ncbi:MAG: hypothetical protein ACFE9L_20325 [Candidatus Hodarchaeota archaeon]
MPVRENPSIELFNKARKHVFSVLNKYEDYEKSKFFLKDPRYTKLSPASKSGLLAVLLFYSKYKKELKLTPALDCGDKTDFIGEIENRLSRIDVTTNPSYKKSKDYQDFIQDDWAFWLVNVDIKSDSIEPPVTFIPLHFPSCDVCYKACINPPTLITANHVIEEYIKKGSHLNISKEIPQVIQKGVYIRFNYVSEAFTENKDTIYEFNQRDTLIQNLNDDFVMIFLSKIPSKKIEPIFPDISYNLPPPFPMGFDPNSFSSFQIESNISMIHHPTEKSLFISTAYKNYRMVHLNWNELVTNGFIESDDRIIEKFKTNNRFIYWALDLEKTPSFIPCSYHGSSGSPIFNYQWKLIGMHIQGSRVNNNGGSQFIFSVGIPITLILDHITNL